MHSALFDKPDPKLLYLLEMYKICMQKKRLKDCLRATRETWGVGYLLKARGIKTLDQRWVDIRELV